MRIGFHAIGDRYDQGSDGSMFSRRKAFATSSPFLSLDLHGTPLFFSHVAKVTVLTLPSCIYIYIYMKNKGAAVYVSNTGIFGYYSLIQAYHLSGNSEFSGNIKFRSFCLPLGTVERSQDFETSTAELCPDPPSPSAYLELTREVSQIDIGCIFVEPSSMDVSRGLMKLSQMHLKGIPKMLPPMDLGDCPHPPNGSMYIYAGQHLTTSCGAGVGFHYSTML